MAQLALAQIDPPRISPKAKIYQVVGFTEIQVEYSRPAARGRKIFGDLVPYGRIWRVGANESTKITFSSDVTIDENLLKAGTYALYAFPEAEKWQVAFHTNLSHWGDGRTAYNPEEDVFRIEVVPQKNSEYQENFRISFDKIDHNGVVMQWQWANTEIEIPIFVNTRAAMRKKISEAITENPSAATYYEAARYFQEQGIEWETARNYLIKALELGGDTYYYHRVLSLVEAQLGNYEAALTAAKRSLELAKIEGKDEFVRMNAKNISKWEAYLKQ